MRGDLSAQARALGISRQRLWQLRHKASGLCVNCSEPVWLWVFCQRHFEAEQAYRTRPEQRSRRAAYVRTRTGYAPWHPGGRGRRPLDAGLT